MTRYLGKQGVEFVGLDSIDITSKFPPHLVIMTSDEVTAKCPVTGQPDFYLVVITFHPKLHLCESKSLKLFFESLRDRPIFAEELPGLIIEEFAAAIDPESVEVEVTQKSRGGISIKATHVYVDDQGTEEEPLDETDEL